MSGDYDFEAQTYDKLARDAQSGVAGNQEMIFAFAAGNAGPCNAPRSPRRESIRPALPKTSSPSAPQTNVRSLSIANGGNTTQPEWMPVV